MLELITLPSAGDIIASTTPYAAGFFGALSYIALALLGFTVAGMAILAIKGGMARVAAKIFGIKRKRKGRRGRRR